MDQVLIQIVSLVGASLILGAYLANHRGWSGPANAGYNLANLVGGGLLVWVAVVDRRAGFIMLELVWALVSVPPLIRSLRPKDPVST